MNTKGYTEIQQQALVDLLVMATYADHHIASAEDSRLQRVLVDMGLADAGDRKRMLDESVSRVRRHTESAEDERAYVTRLARHFKTWQQRRHVWEAMEVLSTIDGKVAPMEKEFLGTARGSLDL